MKRIIAGLLAGAVMAVGTGVGFAAASSGIPEVDQANATIQLAPTKLIPKTCAGEDGISYVTFRGTWKGGETDVTPGSTDYNLSGALVIKGVVWTINLTTDRGLLRAKAELISSTGVPTYAGAVTLITQGLPSAGAVVEARGFVNAATYTNGVSDGGSLLANVELSIGGGFAANGLFGNASLGYNDLSVTTNNKVC